jgi:polyisoprenoid-binding protein YceI
MIKSIKRAVFVLSSAAAVFALVVLAGATNNYMFNSQAFVSEFAARSANNAPPEPAAAGTYRIDPAHTTIGFSVRHLAINDVPGRFNEFSGSIQYNPENLPASSVTFTAKAASIDTGIKQRDDHLRSADFFDVTRYPEITFNSTRIEKKGKDELIAHGDFTMHGVTKQIAIPFKLYGTIKDQRGSTRFGVEARLKINRQDYGVAYSRTLDTGALVVGNDVNIVLLVEAVKQEPKPEPSSKQ